MRTICLLIVYSLLILLLIPVLLICLLIRKQAPIIWLGKNAMVLGQHILGIKLEISGLERLDRSKPYIFMSNHLSFLDGPLLFMVIPWPVRIILKKEIFKIPVIGAGMRFVDFVPVDRKGIRGGKKSIDSAAGLIRDKGYSFLIFPEGTRSRDGLLQKFKRGGFFLALNSRASIAPLTIEGSYELMPKGQWWSRRGTIRVSFHEPVDITPYTKKEMGDLMNRVRDAIQSGLSS